MTEPTDKLANLHRRSAVGITTVELGRMPVPSRLYQMESATRVDSM